MDIKNIFKEYGFELSEKQEKQFKMYFDFLKEENSKYNLTAIDKEQEFIVKHALDSALLLKYVDIPQNASIMDIGLGAGFPSIPMKIIRPDLKLTGLDALSKRVNFLYLLSDLLELQEVEFIHGRAETFGRDEAYRDSFDIVVSRAVAELRILNEFCLPFVKTGGQFVSLKGSKAMEELENAKNSLERLNGKLVDDIEYVLPDGYGERNILVIEKTDSTPNKFPRREGKPKKSPL